MITLLDHFTYDDMERLLTHTQQINGSTAQVIALNEYDPLGQLITKEVGGTSTSGSDRWQEINYTYNIRGWLTEINDMGLVLAGKGAEPPTMGDDLFAFKLQYNTLVNGGSGIAEPLYNGNIAQTFWKTSTDNIQRGYTYNYDQMNRLRAADFYKGGTVPYTGSNGEYIAYDLNGNIVNLIRTTADLSNNAIDMDNLTYTYQNGNNNSNRLMRVEDSTSVFDTNGFLNGNSGTDDYAYDANGNMTKDKNKDITSIEYNYLNLPTEITFGNGNSIEYIYSAAGVKVSKIVTDLSNTTAPNIFTDYLDGFQYVGGMLNFFSHAEGYVRATSQTEDPADPQLVFNYVYNYVDHLGNIRLSYTKDPVSNELDILEENNYYPFGLKHKIYGGIKKDYLKEEPGNGGGGAIRPGVVIDGPYNYKYNGKEYQDELNLNTYAYGWRDYDPAIGRFSKVDRFADKYNSVSPYAYTANNPIRFIDVKGDSINVANVLAYDKANKTDIMGTLIKDLNTITGMTFEVTGDMLTYKLNEDGTVMIDKDADGNSLGSDKAQSAMMDAIDDKNTAFVNIGGSRSYVSDKSGNPFVGGDQIHLSPDEINAFIAGTKGVDNRTMGYGMVFMHETLHTNVAMGGARPDSLEGTGPVVDIMNTIRTELNAQGMNFGTRARYVAMPTAPGSSSVSIPFNGSYIGTTPNTPGATATAGGSVTWITSGPIRIK